MNLKPLETQTVLSVYTSQLIYTADTTGLFASPSCANATDGRLAFTQQSLQWNNLLQKSK